MAQNRCVRCRHPVSSGGNRHREGQCPMRPPNSRSAGSRHRAQAQAVSERQEGGLIAEIVVPEED